MMKAYEVFSATAIGESHVRKGIPREDNVADFGCDTYQMMAVSDGHGDPNCFRSARGSEIAVAVCLEGFKTFAEHYLYDAAFQKQFEIPKYRKDAVSQLITGIEARWSLRVQEDLLQHPIDFDRETEGCDPDKIRRYRQNQKLKNIYGATLIGTVAFNDMILSIQLGDGKCVFLEADGQFSQPMPPDPRCRGNITTSLCDEDALKSFRYVLRQYDSSQKPAAVIITSDGIEDSYRTDELMYCFHRDICIQSAEKGITATKADCEGTRLSMISREGSGDDMSVAALLDTDRIRTFVDKMKGLNEHLAVQEDARYYLERMQSMEMKRKYLKRELDKAEREMHGVSSKLVPNNQIISNYQADKQAKEKALRDLSDNMGVLRETHQQKHKALSDLRAENETVKARLSQVMADLEDLRSCTDNKALLDLLAKATGDQDADTEEKVRQSFEKHNAEKQQEIDRIQEEQKALEEKIAPLEQTVRQLESDLKSAESRKRELEENIKTLNDKIDQIIRENKHLSGDTASKERIYAEKKQAWLDYEEKYRAYESKYHAIVKKTI